jgi:NAD(P)H-hydrate epimerase
MASSASSFSQPDSLLSTGYLDAESAYALDQELMSTPGFSLEQLMELAGLSVAEALYAVLPPQSSSSPSPSNLLNEPSPPKGGRHVVVVCGPGNNGGDGLVAARHLVMFGYPRVTVVYPKPGKHPHYANLVQQCKDVGIDVLTELPEDTSSVGAIVDAIFGFSFRGEPRDPFATLLQEMKRLRMDQSVLLLSVDVPSGWNVDEGDVSGLGFVPDVLVSLTAPKLSAKAFKGRHFVGGRFLPPKLANKYGVRMPNYPGVAQVVEVSAPLATTDPHAGWELEYAAHLAEKEATEFAAYAKDTTSPPEESWEAQYAQYLADREKESRET